MWEPTTTWRGWGLTGETRTPRRAREEPADTVGGVTSEVGTAGALRGSLCPLSWPVVGYEGPLCSWGWVGRGGM